MKLTRLLYISVVLTAFSCDISRNDVEPANSFTKIYDDSRFEHEYYPLDIIQTADGGFLILSEKKLDQSLFTSVYVLKTDETGIVETYTELNDPYAHPVNGWQKIGERYYFVCMDANSLTALLIPVDDLGTVEDAIPIGGITYPLVAAQDGDNIVVLSFDNSNAETVISLVTTTGQVNQQAGYTIGAGVDVEKPIIDHLTRNGAQLPFSVGKTAEGTYFFNGFYNYTFSLVFTAFGDSPTGVCQGQLSQGGISAVSSMGGDKFGVSRFNFGDNYLAPTATISTSSITSSTDLEGNIFPEVEFGSRVKILEAETGNKWLYGTHTNGNQIVLYGFDQAAGTILGTSYLGNGNPYSFASFTFTADGGVAVLAQTALEGRFPRMAVFKRDATFLGELLK